MEKKVVFLDVDGTLVANQRNISDKVKYAIDKARENGHLVFICTGRNKRGIKQELEQVHFDGFIASAGSYIEIANNVIHDRCYDKRLVDLATDVFNRNKIIYNYECTDVTYMSTEMLDLFTTGVHGESVSNSEMERLRTMQIDKFNAVDMREYDGRGVHKMCFIAKTREDYLKTKTALENDFTFVIHEMFSNVNINGEIISKLDNKGTAIKRTMEYLKMNIQDTIGFGDSMNDYEMIDTVNCGVVMANGSEQLKKLANRVCKSVDEDGIYDEFVNLGLFYEN